MAVSGENNRWVTRVLVDFLGLPLNEAIETNKLQTKRVKERLVK